MKEENKRIVAIASVSTIVAVGNAFLVSYSAAKNPAWVTVVTCITAVASVFAWLVGLVFLVDE